MQVSPAQPEVGCVPSVSSSLLLSHYKFICMSYALLLAPVAFFALLLSELLTIGMVFGRHPVTTAAFTSGVYLARFAR